MTEPANDGGASRPNHPPLMPHLCVAGGAAAIDFYIRAFGARELMRLAGPDGRLLNAAVEINGAMVMLADEYPEMGGLGPKALGGTPVTLHLSVSDADAAIARAADAGATVVMPAADMFWGDRYGIVEDPFGHRWSIAHPVAPKFGADLEAAAAAAMQQA
jgi:PhnB protein